MSSQDFSEAVLEKYINHLLISDPTNVTEELAKLTSKDVQTVCSEENWRTLDTAVSRLPDPAGIANPFKLEITRKRLFNCEDVTFQVSPLVITYSTNNQHQLEASHLMASQIISTLKSNQFFVNAHCSQQETQLVLSFSRIAELLQSHGFSQTPVVRIKKSLHVKESQEPHHVSLGIARIPYSSQDILERYRNLAKQIMQYISLGIQNTIILDPSRQIQLECAGQPFLGIENLKNYWTGEPQSILPVEGLLQFVAYIDRRRNSDVFEHFKKIRKTVKAQSGKARLHLLFERRQTIPGFPMDQSDDIRAYRYTRNSEIDNLRVYLPNHESLLVINHSGIVSFCQPLQYLTFFKTALDGQIIAPSQTVSQEFAKTVQNLPHQLVFKSAKESLDCLLYPCAIDISYTEQYSDPKMTKLTVYRPEVKIALRRSDKSIADPLINLLGPQSILLEEYVEVVELPLGDRCIDCNIELQLPQYYFFVSNVHRCCGCAEQQDTTNIEALRRYPVLQNSVLIIKDRVVDVRRLGCNIQPQSEQDCGRHSFICDSCRGGSEGQARYICMGCRREPHQRDYIDFCFECMLLIRGNDEVAKQRIVDKNTRENHTNDHALLRVLYHVADYYRF